MIRWWKVRRFLARWVVGRRYGEMPDGRFGYRHWWLAGWEPLAPLPSIAEIDAAMRVVFAVPHLEQETPLLALFEPGSAAAELARIASEEHPWRVMDEAIEEDRRRSKGETADGPDA